MDILRKELNEIYSRQHLESEMLSDDERLKAIKAVGALAEVQNVCAVITDLRRDCSLLFPQSLGVRLGVAGGNGCLRKHHPAIGAGRQITLNPHTCVRTLGDDTVIIRLKPAEGSKVKVAPYFADGTDVTELYTGEKLTVTDGYVTLGKCQGNVAVMVRR